MYNLLFLCVGNAGRSQMAEAFLNSLARGKTAAVSAGTALAGRVDLLVIKLMQEKGIDISGAVPKQLTQEMLDKADRVITMGCGVEGVCPAKPVTAEDWVLTDSKSKPVDEIRQVRDEIKMKVIKSLETM